MLNPGVTFSFIITEPSTSIFPVDKSTFSISITLLTDIVLLLFTNIPFIALFIFIPSASTLRLFPIL